MGIWWVLFLFFVFCFLFFFLGFWFWWDFVGPRVVVVIVCLVVAGARG